MRIVALVSDLMDRSRIAGAVPDVIFVADPNACRPADVVVVDLAHYDHDLDAVRAVVPGAHIVAFGPHVEHDQQERARERGADVVLARSRFFHDPAAALLI